MLHANLIIQAQNLALIVCLCRSGLLCTWSWISRWRRCWAQATRRTCWSWRICSSSWVTCVTGRPASWSSDRTSCTQPTSSTAQHKMYVFLITTLPSIGALFPVWKYNLTQLVYTFRFNSCLLLDNTFSVWVMTRCFIRVTDKILLRHSGL